MYWSHDCGQPFDPWLGEKWQQMGLQDAVFAAVQAEYRTDCLHKGWLVLTDRRMVYIEKSFGAFNFSGNLVTEHDYFTPVTRSSSSLLIDDMTFWMTSHEADWTYSYIMYVRELLSEARAQSQAASPAATLSVADELKKMAELRDQGILTEEEFAAQKARLLGQ